MIVRAWRIAPERHVKEIASGKGSARFGGRWNSRGTPLVYSSSSRALAALEVLVHLNPFVSLRYVVAEFRFNEKLVESFVASKLPKDWAAEPPPPAAQAIGDRWARDKRTVVAAFPSSIVPEELTYVINPNHPDFRLVTIAPAAPFNFDRRLTQR